MQISGLDYEISKSMYRDAALGCWVCSLCSKTSNKKNNIETHIEAGTKTFNATTIQSLTVEVVVVYHETIVAIVLDDILA